jgi:thiosulfate/3-mercaptopyruvate sulfurtransferase
MHPLITARELAALLGGGRTVRLLDVRWRLDRPDGRPEYLEAHLPGAVYVDLDHELASHGRPEDGRHPLPTRDALESAARRWGLRAGDTVVAYDDAGGLAAARAWWLLSRAGVADVRVLDGGLSAWTREGLPLEEGDVVPQPGDIVLHDATEGIADIDDAAAWPSRGVLLDVRAAERYRGEVEPLDPIAGHIPGAVNLPISTLLSDGLLRSSDELRAAFEAAGATQDTPVAAYCGSGITAAQAALAGVVAGIDVTVYPGSWSQWSNSPGRPVATGAEPGDLSA